MSDDGSRHDRDTSSQSSSDAELSARLKRLEERLEGVKSTPRQADVDRRASPGESPMGKAVRLSAEFVGGPIVGAGLGWALDKALGSSPWGMIVFVMLGFVAGIFNVLRSSGFLRSGRNPGDNAPGG
jgi:ATP synthase protein I